MPTTHDTKPTSCHLFSVYIKYSSSFKCVCVWQVSKWFWWHCQSLRGHDTINLKLNTCMEIGQSISLIHTLSWVQTLTNVIRIRCIFWWQQKLFAGVWLMQAYIQVYSQNENCVVLCNLHCYCIRSRL